MKVGGHATRISTLNIAGTGLISEFETFYENVRSNPTWEAIHKERSFELWGQFIIDAAYVVLVEGSDPLT